MKYVLLVRYYIGGVIICYYY